MELSTMPQTRATKNAYWCRRPRRRGLPRSAGFIRNGAEVVTPPRLRHRKLLTSSEAAHPGASGKMSVMRVRPVGRSALLIECRDGDEVSAWRAELWRRRDAGELRFIDIVPGATTILLDGVESAAAAAILAEWPVPSAVSPTDGRSV